MDMILSGVSETVGKKLGRWGGATFQTYIHTWIISLSKNVSTLIVQPIANFFHVCVKIKQTFPVMNDGIA